MITESLDWYGQDYLGVKVKQWVPELARERVTGGRNSYGRTLILILEAINNFHRVKNFGIRIKIIIAKKVIGHFIVRL